MKKYLNLRRIEIIIFMWIYILTNIIPAPRVSAQEKIIYPLKTISKLDCRFEDYDKLSSDCIQDLPVLNTKDYKKYVKDNWWYNDFTRIYTVLWWSSYKYGWDVWNWWHIWTDIATSKWTPVYAMADWEVIIAKNILWLWNAITIKHNIWWQDIYSNYWHLSKILVSKWQKIRVWDKIWEVWSTWNSTGNHLHFQIDLDTPFHPYYYDYNSCPYSYNQISETDVCFWELKNNTIDPLLFLETKWAILNNIKVKTQEIKRDEFDYKVDDKWYDFSIFDRTVYDWYSEADVKKVQEIFSDLWEYAWPISWNYKDVENYIISYQLSNNIISSKTEAWAWWFGPKTRAQAKNDYENFLDSGWKPGVNKKLIVENNIVVEKISKEWLLSREEIEKKEVDTFLRKYDISLEMQNIWWNIKIGETSILKLEVKDKRWKYFRWTMPSWMTFEVDINKLNVFPERLYNFTDWKRDIRLTWLEEWNTSLKVKVWNEVIKTIDVRVIPWWSKIEAKSGQIYANSSIVIWDKKTWIVMFKDSSWKKLVNIDYSWEFKLIWNDDLSICVKSWSLKDIKNIYKKDCLEQDYKSSQEISYNNSVWGLIIFDYKVTWNNPKIELQEISNPKNIVYKNIKVAVPNWLDRNYTYKDEVLDMLSKWVVDWINKWYFLEERELVESDAIWWIENALLVMKQDAIDQDTKNKIAKNLILIRSENSSKFKTISRKDFLEKAYKYLVFDENNIWITISYKDLSSDENEMANAFFDRENTWKDKFWENYFRPEVKLTRWEGAYFLAKVIDKNKWVFLTSR